jgi:PAS domain S-box-containing protein
MSVQGKPYDPEKMKLSSDGCVVICAATKGTPVISVTDSFTRNTGYLGTEVIGKNLSLLQGPKTSEAAIEMFRFLMRTGESGRIVILNYRKDGTEFWNVCDLRSIRNGAGETTHFICMQHTATLI